MVHVSTSYYISGTDAGCFDKKGKAKCEDLRAQGRCENENIRKKNCRKTCGECKRNKHVSFAFVRVLIKVETSRLIFIFFRTI